MYDLAVKFEHHVAYSTVTMVILLPFLPFLSFLSFLLLLISNFQFFTIFFNFDKCKKEQYQISINERLRILKQRSEANSAQRTPNLQKTNLTTDTINNNPAHSNNSIPKNNPPINSPESVTSAISKTSANLSPFEINQVNMRLVQLKNQLPQIDNLIAYHTRLETSNEILKKITTCVNCLLFRVLRFLIF